MMPISAKGKRVWFVIALLLVAIGVLFPETLVPAIDIGRRLIEKIGTLLPIVPLLVYAVLIGTMGAYAWEAPEAPVVTAMDKQESASLTLTGLCFTSLSLLISFFKDEIKHGEIAPQKILVFFAIALGCFIASYMTLRYRVKNLFPVMSEAFIDNGLWCILVGLWTFSNHTPGLENLPRVLTVFIFLYFCYLALNAYYWYDFTHPRSKSAA
jgi:hypothetical protein